MPDYRPAVVIHTREYVDPTFLYGLSLDVPVFIVDSSGGKIRVNRLNTTVFSRHDIEVEVPGNEIFQYSNGSVSGYIIAKASKLGYDPIIAVEDNCIIPKSFIEFYTKAFQEGPQSLIETEQLFLNTIGLDSFYPRDFPYTHRVTPKWEARPVTEDRHVIAHMGLWRGILDVVPTQKRSPDRVAYRYYSARTNALLPCSYANFAARREAAVLLYPLPLSTGKASDVLAGVVAQRVIAKTKSIVTIGKPTVNRISARTDAADHTVASIVVEFTAWVDTAIEDIKQGTILEMYAVLAAKLDTTILVSPLAKHVLKDTPKYMCKWAEYLDTIS